MELQIHNSSGDLKETEITIGNVARWIAQELSLDVRSADIILTDDKSLREMHKKYLDDDALTDVITFNLSDTGSIEAEIYISTDRVRRHASRFNTTTRNEMMRLIIHAFLHLAGYDDRMESDRKIMKVKEDDMLFQSERKFSDSDCRF